MKVIKKKNLIRRQVADDTRAVIIKTARQLFAKYGFSATTTAAIAKAAKVNETLIFHHFGNKSKLWQIVKKDVIDLIFIEPVDPKPEALKIFLEKIFTQRLNAYQQQPELVRLLQWQRLESKQSELIAGNILAPTNWLVSIQYLQETGKIIPTFPAEIIMVWLTTSINAMILDNSHFLQNKDNRDLYFKTIINGLTKALTP